MHRVATRLAVFAVVLAGVFGAAYALGDATRHDDAPPPVHEMDMP